MKCSEKMIGLLLASALTGLTARAYDWSEGGAGPDYVFGSSTSPLATGSVSVPANQSADSVSAFVERGAAVTFAGGPLTMTSGGGFGLTGCGSLLLDLTTASGGTLFVGGQNETQTFANLYPAKYSESDPTTETVLLANASLSDYGVCGGHLKSSWLDVDVWPYHVRRTGQSVELQLQCFEPNWIRCAKIRLVQKDAGIVLRLVYARQAKAEWWPLGTDFDLVPVGTDTSSGYAAEYQIARTETQSGCGLRDVTLEKTGRGGVVFAGSVTAVDALSVRSGAKATLAEEGSLTTSSAATSSLDLNGLLDISDRSETLMLAGLSGSHGRIGIVSSDDVFEPAKLKLGDPTATDHLMIADFAKSLTSETVLAAVTNVSSVYISTGNKSGGVDERLLSTICCYSNTGSVCAFQAQVWQSPYIKCCVIELTQRDSAIYGQVVYRGYVKASAADVGTDFFTFGGRTDQKGNYYPNTVTLLLEETVCHDVQLTGVSSQLDASIDVGAHRRLILGAKNCLPVRGVVNVGAAGEAETGIAAEIRERGNELTEYSERGGALVNVLPGGVFRQKHAGCFNRFFQKLCVDGGEFAFSRVSLQSGHADDAGCYANFMTLAGGARVTGLCPRIGALNSATKESVWRVRRGTSGESVSHECGLLFVGNGYNQPFVVDVEEFADGAELVSVPGLQGLGSFGDWTVGGTDQKMKLVKRGEGGWLVKTSNPKHRGELIVEAGELVLGVDHAFAKDGVGSCGTVTLAGGALVAAEATVQPLSGLAVTADSTLRIEDGAKMSFADSHALAWTGKLSVEGLLEKESLRFGTDRNALTDEQMRRVRVNGRRISLDEEGYVVTNLGLSVIIR